MAFLDKNGLQTLTNKLVQGDAIKVASHRGHTVKNVIDNITRECETVSTPNTMTLENRVNEFRVGKGRDVDVSGDVEEGKIEVALQGKTWQNVFVDVVSIDGSESALVTNIDKNNLSFEVEFLDELTSNRPANRVKILSNLRDLLKPNTTYTFIYKYTLLENPFNEICQLGIAVDMWGASYYSSRCVKEVGYSGISITRWTTNDQLNKYSNHTCFFNQLGRNSKWKVEGLIVLEGDHTYLSEDESPKYFQGIKSSFEDGVVDVEVVGKNLFDGKLKTFNTNNTYIDNIGGHNNGANNIPIKPNTNYVVTFETTSGDSRIFIWNGDEEVLTVGAGATKVRFKTPLECDSLSFYRNVADYTEDRLKYKIQIEEGIESTTYESYYKKKISFNIGEPLRSLPNGVCDEIRNNNGRWELVRRVGKINASDIQYWYKLATYKKTILYRWNPSYVTKYKAKLSCSGYCNTIPYYKPKSESDTVFCRINDVGLYGALVVAIEKSKLDSNNPNLTQWFSENPTTIYYELAESVVTQIEPIEFEVKPLANMTINSQIAPVSNHTVVLNRAGQIEQGILKIAELRKRVDDLETVYESHLLETQLKLSLLKLDYELKEEI